MNLPRNIVQIGEPNKTHRIYIEDYILSYIKLQIKENADIVEKPKKIILYGREEVEHDITYYFLYGAALLSEPSTKSNSLAYEERQEAARNGEVYFKGHQIKAFYQLGQDIPEGFFILDGMQGKMIYGYACFYEKNESMLAFMLEQKEKLLVKCQSVESPQVEVLIEKAPINVAVEHDIRTPEIRAKQLYRYQNVQAMKKPRKKAKISPMWILTILALFAMVIIRYSTSIDRVQTVFMEMFQEVGEQKIPDKVDQYIDFVPAQLEEELVDMKEEETEEETETDVTQEDGVIDNQDQEVLEDVNLENERVEEQVEEQVEEEPISYVIATGDTLLSISWNAYGTIEKVSEICDYNNISNADSIQVGQTILLP